MELEIMITLWIDVDNIINEHSLTAISTDDTINMAIGDYICELDDADYYLIGDIERAQIFKAVRDKVGKQCSLF